MTARIIRLPQLLHITGLSRSTIRRLEVAGDFPQRIHLGARSVGWRLHDVLSWLERRGEGVRPEKQPDTP